MPSFYTNIPSSARVTIAVGGRAVRRHMVEAPDVHGGALVGVPRLAAVGTACGQGIWWRRSAVTAKAGECGGG